MSESIIPANPSQPASQQKAQLAKSTHTTYGQQLGYPPNEAIPFLPPQQPVYPRQAQQQQQQQPQQGQQGGAAIQRANFTAGQNPFQHMVAASQQTRQFREQQQQQFIQAAQSIRQDWQTQFQQQLQAQQQAAAAAQQQQKEQQQLQQPEQQAGGAQPQQQQFAAAGGIGGFRSPVLPPQPIGGQYAPFQQQRASPFTARPGGYGAPIPYPQPDFYGGLYGAGASQQQQPGALQSAPAPIYPQVGIAQARNVGNVNVDPYYGGYIAAVVPGEQSGQKRNILQEAINENLARGQRQSPAQLYGQQQIGLVGQYQPVQQQVTQVHENPARKLHSTPRRR